MIDVQIRNDFKSISERIGCQGFIANFVSTINEGGNLYPLMVLPPIATSEKFNEQDQEEVKLILYFFKPYQNEVGQTPNETELWQLFGELGELVKAFKKELLKVEYLKKYVITSKINVERNAHKIGYDETVFVKVNFIMTVYKDC